MAFHFASSSSSDSDLDDLPFPPPLAADAFSAPLDAPFSPTAFLASLRNRHQTLEDLRSELRTRSRQLETELVELVNRDYADFASLGSSVHGGEGRVEDLKVGLLGFRREVEGVRRRVEDVKRQVEDELRERERVGRQKALARNLLSLAMRLDELSAMLLLDSSPAALLPLFEADEGPTGPRRLKRAVTSWVYVQRHMVEKVPTDHPFLQAQSGRMQKILETMTVDLRSAVREAREAGDAERCLELLGLLADLGKEADGVRALREAKARR